MAKLRALIGLKSDLSMSERQEAVTTAIRKRFGGELYIAEMYEDRAIYQVYGEGENAGKTFEIGYEMTDAGAVTLGEESTEVRRRTTYTAVKFAKGSDSIIEGYGVPFGGPIKGKDLDGEDFGPDTDLCLDWFPNGRPILYHHGLHGSVKSSVVGRQTEVTIDDDGAFVRAELDKNSRWYAKVSKLIAAGALGFSSGAMPHLVKTTKSGHITRWPWVELSLTPTPANPGAVVYAVKADPGFFTSEDEEDTGSVPFDDHARRIADDVGDFVTRAKSRIETRKAKAGRELSTEARSELDALAGHLGTAAALEADVRGLLARTDPAGKADDVDELEAELVVSELYRSGHLD